TPVGFPKKNWKLGHIPRGGVIATRMHRVQSRYEIDTVGRGETRHCYSANHNCRN
ncbi:Bgt-20620-5, partial [Blumeria graminis f. sp. tritici]